MNNDSAQGCSHRTSQGMYVTDYSPGGSGRDPQPPTERTLRGCGAQQKLGEYESNEGVQHPRIFAPAEMDYFHIWRVLTHPLRVRSVGGWGSLPDPPGE